jgi:hypothetical protein
MIALAETYFGVRFMIDDSELNSTYIAGFYLIFADSITYENGGDYELVDGKDYFRIQDARDAARLEMLNSTRPITIYVNGWSGGCGAGPIEEVVL